MGNETHDFKAEVSALLRLVTNSLYTHSEIFLRELVSNAADALDKARFQALVSEDLRGKELAASIRITADKQAGTLTLEDTGIGMTRDEAARNLGTLEQGRRGWRLVIVGTILCVGVPCLFLGNVFGRNRSLDPRGVAGLERGLDGHAPRQAIPGRQAFPRLVE